MNERLGIEAIRLLREGVDAGVSLQSITEDPGALARRLGKTISTDSVRQLNALGTSEIKDRIGSIHPEAIRFLHRVVMDGRFIETWQTDIRATCDALGIRWSQAIDDNLRDFSLNDLINYELNGPKIAIINLAIAVVVAANGGNDRLTGEPVVVDFSGLPKF